MASLSINPVASSLRPSSPSLPVLASALAPVLPPELAPVLADVRDLECGSTVTVVGIGHPLDEALETASVPELVLENDFPPLSAAVV